MIHRLKTLQPYFDDVKSGKKPFEIRVNDRDYQVGDILVLEEYNNTDLSTGYTGQVIIKSVTYVLTNCSQYGLKDGYCIMGLAENSWIPVSERLPKLKENQNYINVDATIEYQSGDRTVVPLTWERKGRNKKPTWCFFGRISDWNVIAWMPLPEPYKPE